MTISVRGTRVKDRFTVEGSAYQPLFVYPFAHDSVWNTAIGSGLTYVSKSSTQHTQLIDAGGVVQGLDWSDTFWQATTDDPTKTMRQVSFLPAGWQDLTKFDIGPTAGAGTFVKDYTGVYVPTEAHWESVNNQDRKVMLCQPNGYDMVEGQKFQRTTDSSLIYYTNMSRTDLRYYGLASGAIASGISPTGGTVRTAEIARASAGDVHAIEHVLKFGLPNRKLKIGPIWPSRTEDGDANGVDNINGTADDVFTGLTCYGSMLCLDKAVDIEALRYLGSPLTLEAKALAYALQDYGGYVLIRSGSGPISVSVEGSNSDPVAIDAMQDIFSKVLVPLMRIATNSHLVGTLDANRVPLDPSLIAGGGTRRRPYRPPVT